MAYTIETAPAAEKQLAKLPKDVASRIADAIERLAVDPFPPGSKPLEGADKGAYRIRIGDYRVLYEVYRPTRRSDRTAHAFDPRAP
jgi:mRNA interferase RelE/StbE